MQIARVEGTEERTITTAMLVDSVVLGRLADKWDGELFASKWCNLIGGWAVDYYRQYGKAPGPNIQALYQVWAANAGKDTHTTGMVDAFLTSLSGDYVNLRRESNSAYVLDIATKHFNRVRAQRFVDQVQGQLDQGDVDKALITAETWGKLDLGEAEFSDVLRDMHGIQAAFEQRAESLIQYPGALGEFYGDTLERDGFFAFLAPEKRGKTWQLLDVAFEATMQRRKVAVFSVGDMSKSQIYRRLMVKVARHPSKPRLVRYPKDVIRGPDDRMATVVHEERQYPAALDWSTAWKACQAAIQRCKSDDTYLRLAAYPAGTQTVAGLRSVLLREARKGWTPDVVVVDYADILAPPAGSLDVRDGTNRTWQALRALSQELHCLVVTATQANAASYNSWLLSMRNYSEDKRKFAHVTAMAGINQSPDEKRVGLTRLNWLVRREEEAYETTQVHIAGCLALGAPVVRSTW